MDWQTTAIEGSYFPGWDYCHQSDQLSICDALHWWKEEGCPSFKDAATYYFSTPVSWDPYATVNIYEVNAARCIDRSGLSYDVVSYSPTSDMSIGESSVFNAAGQMIAYDNYAYGHVKAKCCEGCAVVGLSWGQRIRLDCVEIIPYDPSDFVEPADTASP